MKILSAALLISVVSSLEADPITASQLIQSQTIESKGNSYFQKYDANRDGIITSSEFFNSSIARRTPELAEKLFANLDRNGDGIITEKEVSKLAKSKSKKK